MVAGRTGLSLVAALALVGAGACGGAALVGPHPRPDASAPDAAADGDAPTADAPDADAADAPDDATTDGDAPEVAAPVLLGLPLPDAVAPPRHLLPGAATLTGAGRT